MPVAALPPPTMPARVEVRPAAAARVPEVRVSSDFARDILEPSRTAREPGASAPRTTSAAARTTAAAPISSIDAALIQRSLESIHLGGTISADRTITSGDFGSVRVDAGTRVEASLDGSSLDISASPGLVLDLSYGPTVRLTRLHYDLSEAKFHVDAEGPGPDFIYRWIGDYVANHHLKPLLFPDLQQPGYSLRDDPNLGGRIDEIVGTVNAGPASTGGVAFRDATAGMSLRLDRDLRMDLPGNTTVRVDRGTYFSVDARFSGPVDGPTLQALTLRTSGDHGVVVHRTEGFLAELQGLEIRGVTVGPGGTVSLDYELIPEQMINGGESLLRLLGAGLSVASGDPRGLELLNHVPDHRLPGFRKQVDAMVRDEAEPAIRRLAHEHDSAVPGMSLERVLGIPSPTSR